MPAVTFEPYLCVCICYQSIDWKIGELVSHLVLFNLPMTQQRFDWDTTLQRILLHHASETEWRSGLIEITSATRTNGNSRHHINSLISPQILNSVLFSHTGFFATPAIFHSQSFSFMFAGVSKTDNIFPHPIHLPSLTFTTIPSSLHPFPPLPFPSLPPLLV